MLPKDYLTIEEAAGYCGVSLSQFKAKRNQVGLCPLRFMGKVLYRRRDLAEAIERCQAFTGEDEAPTSNGERARSAFGNRSVKSRRMTPKLTASLKKLNSGAA
jgi:hypothetical protein